MTRRTARARRRVHNSRPVVEHLEDRTLLSAWGQHAGNAQHTALSPVASQPLNAIHWSVNIDPTPSGNTIHYGSPLVTPGNTVIIPIRTGSNPSQTPTTDTFGLQFVNGADGSNKWTPVPPATAATVSTDYILPVYNWTPSYSPALTPPVLWPGAATPFPRLYFAGAGGTVYYIDNPDGLTAPPVVHQLAFYGLSAYQANPSAYNSTVFIDTPITADGNGDIFFGFQVTGSNPSGLVSGVARIDTNGNGISVSASDALGGDAGVNLVQHNSAPALSADGTTLYVGLTSSGNDSYSWLAALDSTTLALKTTGGAQEKVRLMDPRFSNANPARIIENSSATPMVAPDGSVFFGAFANPGNGSRGFMLHYSADLQTEFTAGAFGWDNTASIVPASAVPSYTGTSSYLIFAKYNNYSSNEISNGGDGVNMIAVLDPFATQPDVRNDGDPKLQVMKEVMVVPGPTPDPGLASGATPNAVREWCINTAAVDPFTKSILANSEDGKLYRWDLTTNTLSQAIRLTGGVGEAYTPTAIGPDGQVYAINDHILFAVGGLANGLSVSETSSATPTSTFGQAVTFTATVTSSGAPAAGSVTFSDGGAALGTVALDGTGHAAFTTSGLSAGRHFVQASYSGAQGSGSMTLVQAVLQTSAVSVSSSPNPSVFGQSVTFTATVSAGGPTSSVPEGTVTFKDGANVLGTGTVDISTHQATFTTTALAVGGHSITAQYSGDTNFTAGTSAALTQTVNKANTGTSVASSLNPSVFGQSVTFTATVTVTAPGAGTPTGTVTFKDGAATLGTGALDATGHATFTTSALAGGSHSITAVYGGDANFNTSTSAALAQTVNKDNTTTTVTSSPNPSGRNQSVTLTATVVANAPGGGVPTGTVTFKDGNKKLGTVPLDATGHATLTASFRSGTHVITATYNGSTNYNTSSGTVTQNVNRAAQLAATGGLSADLAGAPGADSFAASVAQVIAAAAPASAPAGGPAAPAPAAALTAVVRPALAAAEPSGARGSDPSLAAGAASASRPAPSAGLEDAPLDRLFRSLGDE
jgi:hypothetical protein